MVFKRYFFSVIVALFIFSDVVLAQIPDDQDTVLVPYDYVNNNGDITGSLNQFIEDDINDGGVPEGRVYKLQKGQYYLLSGTINVNGFTLRLYGEPADENTHPPVIGSGVRDNGTIVKSYFVMKSHNNIEFKNIYFLGAAINDALATTCVKFNTDSTKLIADNCVFDSFKFSVALFKQVSYNSAFVTNCYFRNLNHDAGARYNGRVLNFTKTTNIDTVILVNNTYVNSNSFLLNLNTYALANYVKIDHNTVVNTVKFVLNSVWETNIQFTNNLFYNAHSYGESDWDLHDQSDPDNIVFGIFNIDTLGEGAGITEAERNVLVTNNSWFYDSYITNYWDSRDTVQGEPFMNSRAQGMFDDNETWPGLVEENNVNYGPTFTKFPTYSDGHVVTEDMVTFMYDLRDGTSNGENNWGFYPDDVVFHVYWPLSTIEDFSYATNEPIYTGGTGGFPIGDLNWFPDKKAEWEDWVNYIEEDEVNGTPSKFELSQNYPNPFNPTTVINFRIPKKEMVTLKIYNVLGQEVATLVNEVKDAGSYHISFNASNLPSGIYLYTLKAGKFSSTKKMMLLK